MYRRVISRSSDPYDFEKEAVAAEDTDSREALVEKYAWAIPNKEAIDAIREYLPITELGAGSGYWASLIGGDITCHDTRQTHFKFDKTYWPIEYDVEPDLSKTLFFCWPPYYSSMAYDYLIRHTGKYVIYVGEGWHGCTACDNFHEHLRSAYTEERRIVIPHWYGLHDRLTIHRKDE